MLVQAPIASADASDAPLVVMDAHHTTRGAVGSGISSLGEPPPVSRLRSPELCDTRKAGKKPLAYVHIFHTAGTSLKQLFCCADSCCCVGPKGPRDTHPPVIGIERCPHQNWHHGLDSYRRGSEGLNHTATPDEDMFTFAVMRDPLSWFESLFVHSMTSTADICPNLSPPNSSWRYCLEPMRDLVSCHARLGFAKKDFQQSSPEYEATKVVAFRKWIEVLTMTVDPRQVLQTQSWLAMHPGDTARPVDCLVTLQDISWVWEFLRTMYHIVSAPEKDPVTNRVVHVNNSMINGQNAPASVIRSHMYDCATARRVYHYARMDFDVLKLSCEEAMPPELAACACA